MPPDAGIAIVFILCVEIFVIGFMLGRRSADTKHYNYHEETQKN